MGEPPRRQAMPSLSWVGGRRLTKLAAGIGGLALFVLALQVLKAAASGLGALLIHRVGVESFASALGFGWVFAYVLLSGSPVAAIGLTFFSAGLLDALQTFAMIAGSRFGAAFVVLLLGYVYALRGKARGQSLEMGVLALLTTYAIYAVAIPVGALLLFSHALDGLQPRLPAVAVDGVGALARPVVDALDAALPAVGVFAAGVVLLLAAFALFDRALPNFEQDSPIQHLEAHVYRPLVMFALGCVVTLFTLSVSVSLGVLVPLSAKGIARRENVIPYIMGANVTTFVDTLFATLFLDKPEAFVVVLVEMLAVAAVSLLVLVAGYARFERAILALSARILRSRASVALFVAAVLIAPLVLLLV